MKKISWIILCILVSSTLRAQKKNTQAKVKPLKVDEKGKAVAAINVGLSATGVFYEALERDTVTIKYTTSVKPALQGTLDYFLSNKVTIGFFFSVQSFRIDISHWEFDSTNHRSVDDLQAKLRRSYIGGKLLYHFKNTEKIDIYSGIRVGVLFWNKKLPSTDPNFVTSLNNEFLMINRPSIGIVPIGIRVKFAPQIAANLELNACAPHIFSFGVSYTLK